MDSSLLQCPVRMSLRYVTPSRSSAALPCRCGVGGVVLGRPVFGILSLGSLAHDLSRQSSPCTVLRPEQVIAGARRAWTCAAVADPCRLWVSSDNTV